MAINAVHILAHAAAEQQAAREAILTQLREAGATSPSRPATLQLSGEDSAQALGELLEAGIVRESATGLFYIEPSPAAGPERNWGFLLMVTLLVLASTLISAVALLAVD